MLRGTIAVSLGMLLLAGCSGSATRLPLSADHPASPDSALTAVGQTRALEFIADKPGDWAMHCHMTHHVMTQMGDFFPNMIGLKPEVLDQKIRPLLPDYMTMAGLFTILKVHPDLKSYDDPGWYKHPPGTVASLALAEELRRDDVAVEGSDTPKAPAEAMASHRLPPPPPENQPAAPQGTDATGHGQHGGQAPATQLSMAPAALYICPIHAEAVSDKPRCPKCGMNLTVQKGGR